MLTMVSQEIIAQLAYRIQVAYGLRNPDFVAARMSFGVWESAAAGLLTLQRNHPEIPIDPELFVASQPLNPWSDPWGELTQAGSFARYRREVMRIIAQLRSELRSEIRYAQRQIRKGHEVRTVLAESGAKMSPLGRYIVACNAGLDDLAERMRPGAERQHRACPLYQEACRAFLPEGLYPTPRTTNLLPGLVIPAGIDLPSFSMN